MDYAYLKAIHIIGVISWMAALLYIVRLFIYHTEARNNETSENFAVLNSYFSTMQRRLFRGIANPAMIVTLLFGLAMLMKSDVAKQDWFHWKLLFLVGLFFYHGKCSAIRKKLEKGVFTYSSKYLRILNEVATLLMVAIVFPAVTKSKEAAFWGIAGFLALGMVIITVIKLRKN